MKYTLTTRDEMLRGRQAVAVVGGSIIFAALAAWCVSKYLDKASAPYVLVKREPSTIDMSVRQGVVARAGNSGATVASVVPSNAEDWVFYVVRGETQEKALSVTHMTFDFVKGGDEAFHVLATHLEPDLLIAVYKEHGAVSAAIVKRTATAQKLQNAWVVASTAALSDDDLLDGGTVIGAEISGKSDDKDIHLRLTVAKNGGTQHLDFNLAWSNTVPIWMPEASRTR